MPFYELFSLLSDETRLRCLVLLRREKELCVCELCQVLDSAQHKVSRHLSILRRSRLVSDEKWGQWVYYKLNSGLEPQLRMVLNRILDELKECEPFRSDHEKLTQYRKTHPC